MLDYLNTEDLKVKEGRSASPVNAAIRKTLLDIPEGKSIQLKELSSSIGKEYGLKSSNVSVRIGTMLQTKKFKHLFRSVNEKGRTCIGW